MKKFFLAICLFLSSLFFLWGISNFASAQSDNKKGMKTTDGCLTGFGKGCFDYERFIFPDSSIDAKTENKTVKTVIQDVILGTTYILGTILMLVIIYCGFMYIMAAKDGKDPSSYKNGLIHAAIGALLVRGGYAIVRLIQYIAKG